MKIRDRIKSFRRVPAEQLQPNPKNWRTHPQAQQDALRGILAEVGIAGAVLARETPEGGLMLIDGHLRAETMTDQEIPVLVLDVTEEEANLLLATFDPLGAMAEANASILDDLLRETNTGNEALMQMLEQLASESGVIDAEETGEAFGEDVPDPPENPVTQPGDLWILGRHRLFCGNSSDPRDVEQCTNGMSWDVAIVDPPYEASATAWLKWIMDPCIVFGQVKQLRLIPDHLWRFERVIVKRYRHRSATTQVAHQHALVAQCGSVKQLPRDKKVTLQSVIEQDLEREHDHQKPVSLLVEHLTHWTPNWKTVLDPFAGSGSTILAAEAMGRSAMCLEIDPGWCDVVAARWKMETGQEPQRIAREDVVKYNSGRAGADTPAAHHTTSAKGKQHVRSHDYRLDRPHIQSLDGVRKGLGGLPKLLRVDPHEKPDGAGSVGKDVTATGDEGPLEKRPQVGRRSTKKRRGAG